MNLTQEQIIKIAKNLSKIPASNPNIKNDLNNILKYFDLLGKVDTENIIPTYSVINKKNTLRKDKLEDKKINRKKLLSCSNQQIIAEQIAINNIMK